MFTLLKFHCINSSFNYSADKGKFLYDNRLNNSWRVCCFCKLYSRLLLGEASFSSGLFLKRCYFYVLSRCCLFLQNLLILRASSLKKSNIEGAFPPARRNEMQQVESWSHAGRFPPKIAIMSHLELTLKLWVLK